MSPYCLLSKPPLSPWQESTYCSGTVAQIIFDVMMLLYIGSEIRQICDRGWSCGLNDFSYQQLHNHYSPFQ